MEIDLFKFLLAIIWVACGVYQIFFGEGNACD